MRILVVDSDRRALKGSAEALQERYPEAEVLSLDDGMDAVQVALNNPVEAVYTEVLLPRINGFDVLRLVRKFRPEAAVSIVSETTAYLSHASQQRLNGYYLKPLVVNQENNLLNEVRIESPIG